MTRSKILTTALCVSLLLNVAGVVAAVKLIKVRGSYHRLVREIKASTNISKRSFVSHLDGAEDMFAVQSPANPAGTDHALLVYLHGMGSNYMEPFMYPTKESTIATAFAKRWPKLCLLSCSYRQQAAWGNDESMADITQNIREVEQQFPIKQIVLAGTSMGGGTALSYAIEAPPDIKQKIVGVVSVEGTGDLTELYNTTHSPQIKAAIAKAFDGAPDQRPQIYQRKSFIHNIDKLPLQARVAVVSALKDDVVPTALQTKIVDGLKQSHRPVHYISVNTPHAVPSVDVYIEALAFALGQD